MMSHDEQDLIRSTGSRLRRQALILALLWGLVAALTGLALAGLLARLAPGLAQIIRLAALPVAALIAGFSLWRARFSRDSVRVALWLEERFPALRYALVTLAGQQGMQHTAPLRDAVKAALPDAAVTSALRARLYQHLRPVGAALALALLAGGLVLSGVPSQWHWPQTGQGGISARDIAPPENRLAALELHLTPPAYTGWPVENLGNASRVSGLTGSALKISGAGDATGITATGGEGPDLDATPHDNGWQIILTLPETATALTLSDGTHRRIIVLEPQRDNAPLARLILPEADQSRPDGNAEIALAATLQDDIGLARIWFEVIVARGESDGNFGFQEYRLAEARPATTDATLRHMLDLRPYDLVPGDQVSIRAVAEDANDITGPGIGYSETRTIRIATTREITDVDLNPAPPLLNDSVLSLRMLIRETERLEARRDSLDRPEFIAAARPLALHAEGIRMKLEAIIAEISEGGAFDVPPLYNVALEAMWEGQRELFATETGAALPHLYRAHEALKALSNLTRYFFRGEALPAIADVEGVRLKGEEPHATPARSARERQPTPRERLAAEFATVRAAIAAEPAAAGEKLTLFSVALITDLPEARPVADEAIALLARGEDASGALARLRMILEGPPQISPGHDLWTPPLWDMPQSGVVAQSEALQYPEVTP